MATIGATFLDLIDLFKRSENQTLQQTAEIIELLKETNEILNDAIAVECNQGVLHRTTVRTGLPSATWGRLYQGIPQTKSTTAQVDDTTGFAEMLSSVDKRLLDLSGSPDAVRLSEATAHIEGMNQEIASKIFYGNTATDPEEFMGLAPRFNDLGAPNGNQIVDAGGSGTDNTSVWFVTWGDMAAHLLYPQGSNAGVSREDKGEQRVLDASSNPYYVLEELFRWHIGLSVRDWRKVARIANIDVSDLVGGSVDILKYFRQAFWRVQKHRLPGENMVIYCNADVMEALDAQITPTVSTSTTTSSGNVRLTPDQATGKEILSYRGIPIRQCDAILNTEAEVTDQAGS